MSRATKSVYFQCMDTGRYDDDQDEVTDSDVTNIQCGMCLTLFPNKEKFVEHSMKVMYEFYVCCKCKAKFKTCMELYRHYDTHKIPEEAIEIQVNDEGGEGELIFNIGDDEAIAVQSATSDTNELLYVLEDSSCVNEVVIEEAQPIAGAAERARRETVEIVNLEHGYVMSNVERVLEEDEEVEDEDGNIIITKKLSVATTPSTSRKDVTPPKGRAPQPRKRHEVPDFSATNYIFIDASTEVDMPHYKCLRCEQLFINKFVFFRHIEKGKCYINNCDVCTATFVKNSEFYLHYIADHTDRAICNFCFRTFMYEKNVKEHMLRHLDQFRHRCEDCNKGFYTVREYRNHYKNRHMGIRHKCGVCSRSFADEYYFKRHIATHAKASKNIALLEISQ